MTVTGLLKDSVKIPKGVTVTMAGTQLKMKGPKGELSRDFAYRRVSVVPAKEEVVVTANMPRKRDKAVFGTYLGHLNNMVRGVTSGYVYEMKIVYSHFPMKAAVKGTEFVIENFLGEETARIADIVGKTKVTVKAEAVTIEGPDKDAVGQTAANIERATKIYDVDPRVFQDGIYIVKKG